MLHVLCGTFEHLIPGEVLCLILHDIYEIWLDFLIWVNTTDFFDYSLLHTDGYTWFCGISVCIECIVHREVSAGELSFGSRSLCCTPTRSFSIQRRHEVICIRSLWIVYPASLDSTSIDGSGYFGLCKSIELRESFCAQELGDRACQIL